MLIVLTVAIAFVSSCKKDETPIDPPVTCHLAKIDMTVFGTTVTSTITYNPALQVVDMETNDNGTLSGTKYSYTAAGKVATMEEYEGASKDVTTKTEYTYGTNGVTEEKIYTDNGGTLQLVGVNRFEYAGTQMTKKNVFSIIAGQEVKTDYMEYSYASTNNVTAIVTYSDDGLGGWEPTGRITYSYNDKTPTRFLLGLMAEDPNFPASNYIVLEREDAYDPIKQDWEETSELDYAYTFDSHGNPTKINAGQGLVIFDLTYNCQ